MVKRLDKFFIPSPPLAEAFKNYTRAFANVAPTDQVPQERLDEVIPLLYAAIDSGKKLTAEAIAKHLSRQK